MRRLGINWKLWIQGLLFIAVAVLVFRTMLELEGIFAAIGRFLGVISSVIMGFVIAYFLYRPMKNLAKLIRKVKHPYIKKRARGLSITIIYVGFLLFVFISISLLLPLIINNVIDFINFTPQLVPELEAFIIQLDLEAFEGVFDLATLIETLLENLLAKDLIGPLTVALNAVTNFAIVSTLWLFDFIMALVISIYVLIYKDTLFDSMRRITKLVLSSDKIEMIKYYILKADDLFITFIGAQFFNSVITGVVSVILLLIIDVEFAIVLGVFLGLANMIPKLGSIVASVVVTLLTFVTGGLVQGLITGVVITIYQQIDGNVIAPKIMGNALKINPIVVFVALIIGGGYFGVVGMFLSIPVAVLLKIILINFIEAKENQEAPVTQVKKKAEAEKEALKKELIEKLREI